MGGRYFIANGTSSVPVFQAVTLWDAVWAVALLLEMGGAHSWPCCWKLTPLMCRLALLAGAMVGSRLQSTQKGLVSLKAAASKAVLASQDCSAGWDYKAREQYGKPKSKLLSWCLYSRGLGVWCWGPYAPVCWCCAQPGSGKKASACWSDHHPVCSELSNRERTWLWWKQYKLKVGLNCLLLD